MAKGLVDTGGELVTPPPKLTLTTNSHLDWLEITYPILSDHLPDLYPEYWDTKTVEGKPLNGYSVARRYGDGRIELFNPDSPNMGIHVIMSATTLQNLECEEKWLTEWFLSNGARVTRMDCALDVRDYHLDFDELWNIVKAKDYHCRLRKPPLREHDAETGDTVYFGRMKSSICTRIYNKAAEQNVEGDWVRVETMFRHSRANNAAKIMVKQNLDCQNLIAGHVQIPRFAWWTNVMTKTPVKTRLERPGENKRYEWLMKSCAPALAKEIFLSGEQVYDRFKMVVRDELERLKTDASSLDNSV